MKRVVISLLLVIARWVNRDLRHDRGEVVKRRAVVLLLGMLMVGCSSGPERRAFIVGQCVEIGKHDPWEEEATIARIETIGYYSYERRFWLKDHWATGTHGLRYENESFYHSIPCPVPK